ncbi:hypothetical protein DFH11DRAFT_1742607 [Phellopilus nigrolimitatus]|nr:hypothetical protein DFH11DRAFT_1742607 [Phellopilus nigrolimitatus]
MFLMGYVGNNIREGLYELVHGFCVLLAVEEHLTPFLAVLGGLNEVDASNVGISVLEEHYGDGSVVTRSLCLGNVVDSRQDDLRQRRPLFIFSATAVDPLLNHAAQLSAVQTSSQSALLLSSALADADALHGQLTCDSINFDYIAQKQVQRGPRLLAAPRSGRTSSLPFKRRAVPPTILLPSLSSLPSTSSGNRQPTTDFPTMFLPPSSLPPHVRVSRPRSARDGDPLNDLHDDSDEEPSRAGQHRQVRHPAIPLTASPPVAASPPALRRTSPTQSRDEDQSMDQSMSALQHFSRLKCGRREDQWREGKGEDVKSESRVHEIAVKAVLDAEARAERAARLSARSSPRSNGKTPSAHLPFPFRTPSAARLPDFIAILPRSAGTYLRRVLCTLSGMAGASDTPDIDLDAHIIINTNAADDSVSDGIVALDQNVNDDLAMGALSGAFGAIDAAHARTP